MNQVDVGTLTKAELVERFNKLTEYAHEQEKLGADTYYIEVDMWDIQYECDKRGYDWDCSFETDWKLVIN